MWSEESRAVFALNLDRLLSMRRLSRKEASDAIGIPYKWLRRAVTHGVSRRDSRSIDALGALARFFGLPAIDDLWRPDLIQMRLVSGDISAAARRQACLEKFAALLDAGQHDYLCDLAAALFEKAGLTPNRDTSTEALRKPVTDLPLVKWVGNKRRQAAQIVERFPPRIKTYHEPFLGGGSVLLRLLSSDISVERFECGDSYAPLVALWQLIKDDSALLSATYDTRWRSLRSRGAPYFFEVRDSFNERHDPCDLFFLLRTCKNGFFRFNRKVVFNCSFRIGRFGTNVTRPDKVADLLTYLSGKLRERDVRFRTADYRTLVTSPGDVMYLDPPYPSVRRQIYAGEFDLGRFFRWLGEQRTAYLLSLDSFEGEDRSVKVPDHLYDERLEIPREIKLSHRLKGVQAAPVTDNLYIRAESPGGKSRHLP